MHREIQKKAAGGLAIVVLPLLGFLNAGGVADLVRARLPPGPLLAPASIARRPPPAGPHATSAGAILARNAFDSVTGPIGAPREGDAKGAPGEPDDEAGDPRDAPPCDGVRVVAIAASDDPDFSLAAFRSGDEAVLRRRGGEIGSRRVAFVGWDRVWLEADGRLCQSGLFAPPADAPAATEKKAPPPPDDPFAKRVRRKGATEVEVDRSVVEEILRDPTALQKTIRVALDQKDGKVLGMRLLGITPQSVLGVLGLENGDRLETINGFDMTKPEAALEAYARLREASHLEVKVDRAGKPTTLTIDVR